MSLEEKILLRLNGLFFFAISLAGIFLNLFLFQLGGFRAVVSYGLTSLIFLFIVYFFSGYVLKKYSSVFVIRLGFLLFTILYVLLLVIGEKAVNYLVILGIINGVANGNYWAGYNLTSYIATHEQTRSEFFGKLNFFGNIASAFGPILGGALIFLFGLFTSKIFGYITLFAIVSLVFFIAFLITAKLPEHKGNEFNFRAFIEHRRKTSWKVVLSQQFLYGLFDVSFSTFSSILMFLFLKEEFVLGSVNTVSTVVFALANILAIKILGKNKRSYIWAMIISPLALFLFALQQNWLGIFGLVIINNLFLPLLNITTSKAIYDVIDTEDEPWQQKYHFLVERDMALGAGRIITYAILLALFTPENQVSISKTWILIVPIFPLLIGLLQLYRDYAFEKKE